MEELLVKAAMLEVAADVLRDADAVAEIMRLANAPPTISHGALEEGLRERVNAYRAVAENLIVESTDA